MGARMASCHIHEEYPDTFGPLLHCTLRLALLSCAHLLMRLPGRKSLSADTMPTYGWQILEATYVA